MYHLLICMSEQLHRYTLILPHLPSHAHARMHARMHTCERPLLRVAYYANAHLKPMHLLQPLPSLTEVVMVSEVPSLGCARMGSPETGRVSSLSQNRSRGLSKILGIHQSSPSSFKERLGRNQKIPVLSSHMSFYVLRCGVHL